MANSMLTGLRPSHPGRILRRDVVPALGRPVSTMAREIGISRQQLHDILAERKPITVQTALRLGRYLGNGPELWIGLQNRFDLANAAEAMAPALASIVPAEVLDQAA